MYLQIIHIDKNIFIGANTHIECAMNMYVRVQNHENCIASYVCMYCLVCSVMSLVVECGCTSLLQWNLSITNLRNVETSVIRTPFYVSV